MTSYCARFCCAICQGDNHTDYCVLKCGHPFHVLCIQAWIGQSASCPICREKVQRRAIYGLVGCETVPDEPPAGSGVPADEAQQRHLAAKQQQVESLRQQLEESEAKVQQLQEAAEQLADLQERLQQKLTNAKHRCLGLEQQCRELEQQRSLDSNRLRAAAAERDKLQEKYLTDVQRLQLLLKDEQCKQRRAAADLRRLQLANPGLRLADIQRIAAMDEEDQPALAAALAQRNEQLQAAEERMQQLQELLQHAEKDIEQALLAQQRRHAEELQLLEQDKEQHLKESLELDYDNSKLRAERDALAQQLHELRGVLLVMEGRSQQRAAPQQFQHKAKQQQQQHENLQPRQATDDLLKAKVSAPSSSRSSVLQPVVENAPAATVVVKSSAACVSISGVGGQPASDVQQQSSDSLSMLLHELGGGDGADSDSDGGLEICCSQQQPAAQPAAGGQQQPSKQDDWQQGQRPWAEQQQQQQDDELQEPVAADLAAALGPGSLLRAAPQIEGVPSFMRQAGRVPSAGAVSGPTLIRHGPDGRGRVTACLASSAAGKRVRPSNKPEAPAKRPKAAVLLATGRGGQTGITSFFAGSGSKK